MIAIIDYGVGNVGSIFNMFNHLGISSIVSKDPSVIENASKLILPGVGSFDQGMTLLNGSGLRDLLDDKVLNQQTPILGICLGMQMMTKGSEEGILPGLNWVEGECLKFKFADSDKSLRIPHMGWNDVIPKNVENSSFQTINNELRFYFAHSYHLVCNEDIVTATASYGYEFPVAFKKNNISGAQFHPEKSHQFGMNFLKAFAQ
jgi:imidazole glycerol-phosphate synthase subunit HisH